MSYTRSNRHARLRQVTRSALVIGAVLAVNAVGVPAAHAAYHANTTGSCNWTAENYRPYGLYYGRTTINTSQCLTACVRLSTTSTWTCVNGAMAETWQTPPAGSTKHQVVTNTLTVGNDSIAF
jgi:hypothetical protein